jgi:Flp pilus assembly protein TadG
MRSRRPLADERGLALVHMAVFLTLLLLFIGLAVDTGRAYVVKAQLSKAVDGAALGAARMLNSGNPRLEAQRIFNANFPPGYFGITSVTNPASDPNFYRLDTVVATGENIVTIRATAVLPTTFMRLGNFTQVTVNSEGEARRRLVDLSLVIDVSSSIGADWGAVRDAVREFINAFDQTSDRISLTTYGWGSQVLSPMPSVRGFNKTTLTALVPNSLPGGVTPMAEGLYRGWDELRTVPAGQQSGLRVIVLFTDGSGNTVPGLFDASGTAKGLFTSDFPRRSPDPGGITTDTPTIMGLYQTETGTRSPSVQQTTTGWNSTQVIASVSNLPVGTMSTHAHHRSAGIPTSFPLQTNSLTVNGIPQSTRRGLRSFNSMTNRYPAQVFNIRNAATNLTEIIANAARSDADGDYPVRIYTIGMGSLVRMTLGTIPETSESVLMRVANDVRSADYISTQLEGRYYYAATAADVGPAFQQLQSQIVRLSK